MFPTLNQNRELLIPFSWNLPKESKVSKLIAKEIWNFYFQGKSLSKSKDMSLRWVDVSYKMIKRYKILHILICSTVEDLEYYDNFNKSLTISTVTFIFSL